MRLGRVQHVHLVGIGGSGMSGIAEVLVREGFRVSGSDQKGSDTTHRLEILGCKVHIGHSADNVAGADVLVYSTAVAPENPERIAAEKAGIPCIRRGEMLAELMRLKVGIAVAGAHGKTTTTTLTGLILDAAGFDPTVVVGGRILGVGGNTIPGRSEHMVAEADESDGSFLLLSHAFGIVTNLDREHMDHYGSYEALEQAFCDFMNEVPFWGAVVVCRDNPALMKLLPRVNRRVITYGLDPAADVRGEIVRSSLAGSDFRVVFADGRTKQFFLPVPGRHIVQNAVGAIALAAEMGADLDACVRGLASYQGIHRRLERKFVSDRLALYDDYAHHPTEIAATIRAVKENTDKPIYAVFQPHRFTRTADLWSSFGPAFVDASAVWVMPVYSAGETPMEGITTERLIETMRAQLACPVHFLPHPQPQTLLDHVSEGTLLMLGAGTITKFAEEVKHVLEKTA